MPEAEAAFVKGRLISERDLYPTPVAESIAEGVWP